MEKIIRTSTVALSLNVLLKGQLNFLNKFYKIIAVSGEDKHLQIVKDREQVEIRSIKMEREISVFKDVISLYKLFRIFKTEKPLIVHSITPKAGLLSMLAARMANVPVRMHTFTGLIFPSQKGMKRRILITVDKILCRAATHVYPEGNGVKQELISYNITSKPLKVLANGNVNGIDITYFDPDLFSSSKRNLRTKLEIPQNAFVFVFVGRLVGDKGINELVSAFQNLSIAEEKECRLLLVGPMEKELDPLKPSILQAIENNPNIISVGYQDDVRPYFSIADALAFPSYREGFPNVVMQAGAMELPSIVTDINGCNEIIVDGENGLIIPPKSVDALVSAMEKLISDKALYKKLKSNARRMIQERYEQQVVWDAILNEYNRLLKEKGLT